MSKRKDITVLHGYRPLTDEELSVELTPNVRDEETAAEIAPSHPNNVIQLRNREVNNEDETAVEHERSGLSVTGVILSVLSLFFLPYVLAPIGIVLGYMGFKRGDHALGMWAVGLGVIGLLGTLIVSAFL